MCGRYQLLTKFADLPSLLKKDLPRNFEKNYAQQELIRPGDPVLVLKNEGKITASIMLWGFISEWSEDPFAKDSLRPFNARAETVGKKRLFKGSWRHKRCLIISSGFFEKGHRIIRKDKKSFWLGGIWNRWMSDDGSEIESCCVLTTTPNELIKPLHNRMPVVIPNGLEEEWISPVKDEQGLRELEPMLSGGNPDEWEINPINSRSIFQMSLF